MFSFHLWADAFQRAQSRKVRGAVPSSAFFHSAGNLRKCVFLRHGLVSDQPRLWPWMLIYTCGGIRWPISKLFLDLQVPKRTEEAFVEGKIRRNYTGNSFFVILTLLHIGFERLQTEKEHASFFRLRDVLLAWCSWQYSQAANLLLVMIICPHENRHTSHTHVYSVLTFIKYLWIIIGIRDIWSQNS